MTFKNSRARRVHGQVTDHGGIVHLRYRVIPRLRVEWTMCGIEFTPNPGPVQWAQAATTFTIVPLLKRTKKGPNCIGCMVNLCRIRT